MTETINESGTVSDAPVDATPVDYFGFQLTKRHYLPDGIQWFEIAAMNEGDKTKYQQKTSRDLVVERQSGNARMRVDPAAERHELIISCTKDWYVVRGGQPVPFTKPMMGDFLTLADPRIVEDIEKAIRKMNPWLLAEMTSEDIQKEIDNLEEMKQVALERERGESS